MSRYLLRDVQAVLRGVRKVAESSLKLETEKVSLRLGDFRSQPSLRSVPASLTSRSQAFSLQEIAARAGVVLRGVQQQFRNVTGVNAAPVVAFDNGSVLYSERIHSQSSQKQAPTTVPTGSVSNSPQPEGKANEAAERAKQFMNPPVAPMDPVDKNEFVAMPEMGRSNGNGENKQAADFMKNQGDTDMDSQYAPDSSKNTKSVPTKEIVAEDGSMSIEDIKKATQVTPGVAVKNEGVDPPVGRAGSGGSGGSDSTEAVIKEFMRFKVHMEGSMNGHEFEIEGEGEGRPYEGTQTAKLRVTKGGPLPFSWDILSPQFMYGSRAFTKHPADIPDYWKQSFPEGFKWERVMNFEDGGAVSVAQDTSLEDGTLIYKVKLRGTNFPPDGPVMQKKTMGWEASTERLYPEDVVLKGDIKMALRLKDGGRYLADFKTTYRAKKPVQMPGAFNIDRKLDITSHNEDYTVVEQYERSVARHSTGGSGGS